MSISVRVLLVTLLSACAGRFDGFVHGLEARGATVGLVVASEDGAIRAAHRPDVRALPASTLKLVSTFFALDTLGADFRYTTRAWIAKSGDVCLEASGDPSFLSRRFPDSDAAMIALADRIARVSPERFTGALSRCVEEDAPLLGPGWAWDDVGSSYSARPTRLMAYDNVVRLRFENGALVGGVAARLGLVVSVRIDPEADGASCDRPALSAQVTCTLKSTAAANVDVGLDDPLPLLALRLEDELRARGIEWKARTAPPPPSREGWAVLLEVESPSLRELVRVTNQMSVNAYAERLALTAAERLTGHGDYPSYARAISEWLGSLGIARDDVTVVDGSGLSRLNAITPRALVRVLQVAPSRPSGDAWLASFAIAGRLGTLRRRGKESAAEGFVFAKTGTLTHHRGLAGLAYRGDQLLIFALLIAQHPGTTKETDRALDAFMTRLLTR